MSKINCDVCGTRYPESAEQCPICGCVNEAGVKAVTDSVDTEEIQAGSYEKVRGGRFSKSNVRKRNKNMVYSEVQADYDDADNTEDDAVVAAPRKKSGGCANAILNFLLVVVILALLLVTAYIFMQHKMPDVLAKLLPTEAVPTETMEPETEAPETEEPTVPCTGLVLTNGTTNAELTELGQAWPLVVEVVPAGCTDELVYASSDENVAMVTEEGYVVAVGPGTATITVTCGAEQIDFTINCNIAPETEPPTEAPATEAPTEAPTEPPKELRVDRTDMTFRQINETTYMKLYNGLSAKDVTWTSRNEGIVKVNENGKITCVGWGTTRVIATYGDQEVTIICRCIPYTAPTEGEDATEAPGATTAPEAPAATEAPATEAPSNNDGVVAVG